MPLLHTVEEVKLKNGARGLLISVPGTTAVRYDVNFHAGNNFTRSSEVSQTAHILEHMSFGANAEYPSLEAFSLEFSKNGAYSNATTSSFDLVYNVDAPLMEWERILALQQLAITQPRYTQASLDSEKGNVSEEIIGYANNPSRLLWQKMMRLAGLKRWFDADELKTVDNVTLADIEEHFNRTHTLKNMRFIVAGDIQKHRKSIIDHFEGWELPAGKELALEPERIHSTGLVHIKRKELENLSFSLNFYINRSLKRREVTAINTLCHILTDTMHSRIWGTARSRGICYGMGSWGDTNPTGYAEFGFGGQVSFKNATALFTLMIDQLKEISKSGVTQAELERAKEYRLGALQMGTETVRSLAGWYGDHYFDYGVIDRVDAMPDLIKGTTIEEIRDLVQEFLTDPIWSFGGIGNITKAELQKHYDQFAKDLIEG
jgi:predicted Zn-dependent peptidase